VNTPGIVKNAKKSSDLDVCREKAKRLEKSKGGRFGIPGQGIQYAISKTGEGNHHKNR